MDFGKKSGRVDEICTPETIGNIFTLMKKKKESD